MAFRFYFLFLLTFLFSSCSDDTHPDEPAEPLTVTALLIDGINELTSTRISDVKLNAQIEIIFSAPVNPELVSYSFIRIIPPTGSVITTYALSDNDTKITFQTSQPLPDLRRLYVWVSPEFTGKKGETFSGFEKYFYTKADPTPKMPLLPHDEDDDNDYTNDLLSVVQKQTFQYFWDEHVNGMARERKGSAYVTSGGTGFGIMALIVGMERNFVTQAEGLDRMNQIVTFLENADRFHGAWPHWMHSNGNVWPFSTNDNGGDLVETAFLVEGLITFRQYLVTHSIADEHNLVNRINTLWEGVEWDWYRKETDEDVLYWHWSPSVNWTMNLPIRGWNECLITYVLAASAPDENTIPQSVYDNGWARNGGMLNGNTYEGITLPLGQAYGGPLFFSHYSFLGLDPRNLSDPYANYWTQNVNHSRINYKYCVRNPKNFVGYSEDCWGLTASDNHQGYSAHHPNNDLGVITPTAALSSFPYTPTESMKALKFFYYTLGDRLWGEYGFYDAFNITQGWTASSYLAIDQGPIIVMIENYRTGLLWDLFMSAPEVQAGLNKLNFSY